MTSRPEQNSLETPLFVGEIEAVAARKDRQAFKVLFDHFAPRVKAYMKRIGSTDEAAEELAQETLLSVWRRASQYDSAKAAPSTWIFTIARNKRIDALRKERRISKESEEFADDGAGAPRGDDYVRATEVQSILRNAMAELPRDQADLLRVFYFEEKTHTTIAEEYKIPLGTVKSRLRLALGKLRNALGDHEL